MTTTNNKLDNDTVRRLSKLISGSKSSTNSTPIMTGTVVQNDNSLYVAIDDDTLVPISDTNSNVSVGDTVTLALDDNKALIVGNITDTNATTSEVRQTNVKVAKAQATAEGAEKVATNYIDIDENKGITVGNMQSDTLGHNTYIDANGVSIRDGETVLASFEDDEIALGKNSPTSSISMCNGKLNIKYRQPTTTLSYAEIYCSNGLYIGGPYNDCPYISLFKDDGFSHVSINLAGQGTGLYYVGSSSSDAIFTIDGRMIRGEELLYSSDTGTTSTVTLSESAANFIYLEIYYKMSINNMCGSVKIYSANNKYATISETFWNNNAAQTEYLSLVISETSIQRNAERYTKANGSTVTVGLASTPLIYITRVVGIK